MLPFSMERENKYVLVPSDQTVNQIMLQYLGLS